MNDRKLWRRLRSARNVEKLGLPDLDGRLVIEGLTDPFRRYPTPVFGQTVDDGGLWATFLETVWFKRWENLHFAGCDLSGASFVRCLLRNCVFERCLLNDTGFRACEIVDTEFRDCRMDTGMEGRILGRFNSFTGVTFRNCDLRPSSHGCESYTNCAFEYCRLEKVDFWGTQFENCVFKGDLGEVIFHRTAPCQCPNRPPNELRGCDFREADIKLTSFIGISMDPSVVKLPEDPDIIHLRHGPLDWAALLESDLLPAGEGRAWYVRQEMERAGTPSLATTGAPKDWSPEVFEFLRRVGSADAPPQVPPLSPVRAALRAAAEASGFQADGRDLYARERHGVHQVIRLVHPTDGSAYGLEAGLHHDASRDFVPEFYSQWHVSVPVDDLLGHPPNLAEALDEASAVEPAERTAVLLQALERLEELLFGPYGSAAELEKLGRDKSANAPIRLHKDLVRLVKDLDASRKIPHGPWWWR